MPVPPFEHNTDHHPPSMSGIFMQYMGGGGPEAFEPLIIGSEDRDPVQKTEDVVEKRTRLSSSIGL